MTTATRDRYQVDAETRQLLALSYGQLVKAGNDSVRMAWRFGQTVDSLTDSYSKIEMAEALGISYATIHRYHRFFGAYQRPELAVTASEELETFNIDLLWHFAMSGNLPPRSRALAGRHFRYRCTKCHSTEYVQREEYDPDEPDAVPEPVAPVRFIAGAAG
ncbi:MAG: hypothetical protein J2P30_01525 [Actinobacteria bacterium]|nr:hypothetical protein [Actinomycetota bacterium]